ncbi:Spy/CpxP family protein refolding chaperone [Orenia metallireducens]|uniref:Protein refolding chaperone Spy/CpxP family n=1 Tax=Orenia metallireducens TaxID=1413210 RepID=A0A285HCJ2_9FIRM|nr:Spy/CpxP family protein refolding chaperone [Orenia metallireducens]PRX27694.1 Spy/CpxP family protein refolding chaperone [Orenia metallireducens]SNY33458.1 protein refolding chaperone Spy/CpxP family [Orenia metallireducens]
MRKILSFALVMTLVLGVSVYAFAHGSGNGFAQDSRSNYRNNDFRNELNISKEQKDKIEDLQDKYHDQIDDLMDDMRDKRRDLRDLYFDKGVKDDVLKLQAEINQLRDKMSMLMAEMQLEIRDILTAEQLEVMEDHGMMGFGMMGGRGFGGHMAGGGMMGSHMMHGSRMMVW